MIENAAEAARAEHLALSAAFRTRCRELGLAPNPRLFWYHTIDLGDGLITPGSFDYRAVLAEFSFPPSMTGMTALDVGSATGFFAFEFERRGAATTSIEIPSLADWDRFPGESPAGIIEKIRARLPYHSVLPQAEIAETFRAMSVDDLYTILLDGPFKFCCAAIGSTVNRVYSTIYDLEKTLGRERFYDWVMLGDILLHTINPLEALASAAKRCAGTLVIADDIVGTDDDPPAMLYIAGPVQNSDAAEWWRPNVAWYRQALARLGFRGVKTVSALDGRVRPGGERFRKLILHAIR
jgi:tRNA (mo5U34)-methyltransferase